METNEPKKSEGNLSDQPPEELDELQQKVRDYPEDKWNLIQRVGGAALGVLSGFLLTYFGSFESTGLIGTIGAVAVALLVPNLVEKRIKRSLRKARVALMIALGVWLIANAAFMMIRGVPFTTNPA